MINRQFIKVLRGGIFLLCFLIAGSLSAQNLSPDQIRQKMAKIRQSTNWNDSSAANKANEEIQKLAKQLMLSGKNKFAPDKLQNKEEEEKNVDFKMGLWKQMMKAASEGESADILLGKPVREEIVEEHKEAESPKNITPEFLQEMTLLVIDMSLSTIQRTIDLMQNYQSIKTLIITGGKNGAPVNLQELLKRASKYPLENLYIINFGLFVTKIPEQINQFSNLSYLGMFNNKISQLPKNISSFTKLDSLFIDINPITTLFPAINSMKNLKTLGIAKTSISDAEIKKIQKLLPGCKVIIK